LLCILSSICLQLMSLLLCTMAKNDQGHAVKLVLLAVLRLFMVLRLRSTHASALLLLVSCQCCWDVKLLVCNGCM
jgi:hypothetical protein